LHQGSIQIRSARTDTTDLAGIFATRIQQTRITEDLLQIAGEIAQQKYATEAWLRKF
jgi:hypothetical protein